MALGGIVEVRLPGAVMAGKAMNCKELATKVHWPQSLGGAVLQTGERAVKVGNAVRLSVTVSMLSVMVV